MNQPPKMLYLSDLDGTLLTPQAELSQRTKDILNTLLARGVQFTYATARSFSSASKIVQGLHLTLPAITYNGAFLVAPDGTVLDKQAFAPAQVNELATLFEAYALAPLVYSLSDRERVSWVSGKENAGLLHYLQSRKGDPRLTALPDTSVLYEGDPFYFTVIGRQEELRGLAELLKERKEYVTTFGQEMYGQGEYWLEIMPPTATKAQAMRRLRQMTGSDRVICFGDASNDCSMFLEAEEAYAVANAKEELKALAAAVIDSNEEDGVAQWMLWNAVSHVDGGQSR